MPSARAARFRTGAQCNSHRHICLNPLHSRFHADFDVHIEPRKAANLSPRQLKMLQSICASPVSMREVGRLLLLTDLSGLTDRHFDGLFRGPSDQEILQAILPWLSAEERAYWEELRLSPGDTLAFELMPVFLVLTVTLRRAGVEDLTSSSEPWKAKVGPTINA